MKALVSKNSPTVHQIVEDNQVFETHEEFQWINAPVGCTTEWIYKEGILVEPDEALVTYDMHRRNNYPTVEEQLDILYHEGYEGWKAAIDLIKNKYPKPE